MAFDVHLSITFACDDYNEIHPTVEKHLPEVRKAVEFSQHRDGAVEAQRFLEDLLKRKGDGHCGHKGGLCTWGVVGNYTNTERFVDVLKPFWKDLLTGIDRPDGGSPSDFEHVIVFYEKEQSERAHCYDIWVERVDDQELKIVHHKLPFCWGQF
ncbi:hypothetical protein LCGC14_0320400 [marine sediment metagenome]|uniref:Uncharacterized protein n=1 Tax=marine sediment metagenome TaxID=412755 RepID=A0A0F9U2A0_9ZZZZ